MSKSKRASTPCSNLKMVDNEESEKLEQVRHLKALKAEEELRESYRIKPRGRVVF
jgi:hypothetical protein